MKALTLTFALLLLCTGAALAQTPDGETPAEETVCNNETGAAYGLCNAYCEAMDCDSESPQASDTACSRVQDKFQQITGRDLPCEAPVAACPCQDIPQWSAVLEGANFCYLDQFGIDLSFEPRDPSGALAEAAATFNFLGEACAYFNSASPENNIILPLTAEQHSACFALEQAAAATRGLTCQ
jgi:hypothetical protein